MTDELRYPYQYTQFDEKHDALWDGDPAGDYIMADHVNKIQDAVVDIEKYLGLRTDDTLSLSERLDLVQQNSQFRIPSFHWFKQTVENTQYNINELNQFDYVILNQFSQEVTSLVNKLDSDIVGVVDTQLPLNTFQTQINEWKNAGASGIFLLNFGLIRTRADQQIYLNSVYDTGLMSIVQTDKLNELTNNKVVTGYNPTGDKFIFKEDTYIWYPDFGYTDTYITTKVIYDTIYPQVIALKQAGLKVIGQANVKDQHAFSFIQTLGMLLVVDGLYVGLTGGNSFPALFDWHTPLIPWRTDKLVVNQAESRLYRNLPNGSINIEDIGISYIKGNVLNSSNIRWALNSIPGDAIQEGSLPPSKLSTYDVHRIVELINQSDENTQIDLNKISMGSSGGLPANIPAINMRTNVILAINQASDPLSTNNSYIDEQLISTISASKIVGKLKPEIFEDSIIKAINKTNNEIDNFINIKRLDVGNINITGSISNAATIITNQLNSTYLTNTETITTKDSIVTNKHTAYEGEYEILYANQLTVDTLKGLKHLEVESISAGNMDTLVLNAIEAQIDHGVFNQIVTNSLKASTIQADLVTALNSVTDSSITNSGLFGEAVIKDASIVSVSANKLNAGTINTGQIDLSSPGGHLKIKDRSIKIYSEAEGNADRKLRAVLGNISDTGVPSIDSEELGYGLLVLGQDGTTRLYDHTGVYNAGLHNNTVSEEKIQDDSISSRVIQTGAIIADHIQAETITGDKLVVDTITGREIKAGSITAGHILANTITSAEIEAESILATSLSSDVIESRHIKAGVVTADKLTIGLDTNQIKHNYDSFEQYGLGPLNLNQPDITALISNQWAFDGNKSLRISGSALTNRFILGYKIDDSNYGAGLMLQPNTKYAISAYVRTYATGSVTSVIGVQERAGVPIVTTKEITDTFKRTRIQHIFTTGSSPKNISVLLGVDEVNTEVYFDGLQVEQLHPEATEAGPWRSTSLTFINGESITTGQIEAKHIKIGTGTIFGGNDIITISDSGIKANSLSGSAMLNSKGLEVIGGAISIRGGDANNTVSLDGNTGLEINNATSRIEVNTTDGIRITNKVNQEDLFSIDPVTGNLRIAGSATFVGEDNSLTLEETLKKVETSRRVFTSQPVPPYSIGDLWVQGNKSHFMYAVRSRTSTQSYQASDWELATPYTDDTAIKNFTNQYDKKRSIQLHMLMHYSDFTTQTLNNLYFVGTERRLDTYEDEAKDIDGAVYDLTTGESTIIPKQRLDLSGLTSGTNGYLIFNSQTKLISFIYYEKDIEEYFGQGNEKIEERVIQEGWKLYNLNDTKHGQYITLGNNTYIIGELER